MKKTWQSWLWKTNATLQQSPHTDTGDDAPQKLIVGESISTIRLCFSKRNGIEMYGVVQYVLH